MSRMVVVIASLAAIVLVLGAQGVIAKPKIASGSNCSSDWVHNEGAMQCFIQGEEEAHAGAAHPHYVACAGGDVFCCQDDNRGNQNCVAQAGRRSTSWADLVRAILAAQRTHLKIAEGPAPGGTRLIRARGAKSKSAR
jgi:hypothetical protein